jgi:hypothetical protein
LSDKQASFKARWQAEAVRLLQGAASDRQAEAEAREGAAAEAEQRVLRWAAIIGVRHQLPETQAAWRRHCILILMAISVLALAGGFTTALAVLGDGTQPVNIPWALGGLLGLNLLMLLFWLLGMLVRSDGAMLGRLVFQLTHYLPGEHHKALTRAFATLNQRADLMRWWLGLLSHTVWLCAMLGALLGLLWTLALRSYAFTWETTILSADVFTALVHGLSVLPQTLGLTIPDAATLVGADQSQADEVRRQWAAWLTASVALYGLMPRLVLILISSIRLLIGLRQLRLQTTAPEWAPLVQRLSPDLNERHVTDPAPEAGQTARIVPVSNPRPGTSVLVAYELAAIKPWPPADLPEHTQCLEVNSRGQRQQSLSALAEARPHTLMVICDARLSPDRGTLHWLVNAGSLAGLTQIVLHNSEQSSDERLTSWHDSLRDIGVDSAHIHHGMTEALIQLGVHNG